MYGPRKNGGSSKVGEAHKCDPNLNLLRPRRVLSEGFLQSHRL